MSTDLSATTSRSRNGSDSLVVDDGHDDLDALTSEVFSDRYLAARSNRLCEDSINVLDFSCNHRYLARHPRIYHSRHSAIMPFHAKGLIRPGTNAKPHAKESKKRGGVTYTSSHCDGISLSHRERRIRSLDSTPIAGASSGVQSVARHQCTKHTHTNARSVVESSRETERQDSGR